MRKSRLKYKTSCGAADSLHPNRILILYIFSENKAYKNLQIVGDSVGSAGSLISHKVSLKSLAHFV